MLVTLGKALDDADRTIRVQMRGVVSREALRRRMMVALSS